MFIIALGFLAILVPIWLFLVIGKFLTQFTKSSFMEDLSWWVVLIPVWVPTALFIVVFIGVGLLLVIMKFGFGFQL